MKWDTNELKNQCVHLLFGFWSAYALYLIFHSLFVLFSGLAIGIGVEIYQYFYKKEDLYILDRLRDISFYVFGSLSFLLVFLI